jgi:hypothetical protein
MSLAAPTLFDIALRVYDELGELTYGVATGGSATTLVDSGLGGADDDYNSGTVFVVEADGASPEGEFAEVTDYTTSTGTLTFSGSGIKGMAGTPASGDEYAVATKRYTLDKIRGVVNRALSKILIPTVDESLSTAATTKEYTIPAVANDGLRRVYISQVSTASNEGWVEMFNWRQETNTLIFREQPVTGQTIKLVYMAGHTRLAANSDALSSYVPLNRAVAEALYLATVDRIRRKMGEGAEIPNDLIEELQVARKMYPVLDPGTPYKPILSGKRGRASRRRAAYGPWIQS